MTPYERDRRVSEWEWWCGEQSRILRDCNPLVADCYRRLAWERVMKTGTIDLTPADYQRGEIALVSALRVARHGPLNAETAYEQHRAIREELRLPPVPITIKPRVPASDT